MPRGKHERLRVGRPRMHSRSHGVQPLSLGCAVCAAWQDSDSARGRGSAYAATPCGVACGVNTGRGRGNGFGAGGFRVQLCAAGYGIALGVALALGPEVAWAGLVPPGRFRGGSCWAGRAIPT